MDRSLITAMEDAGVQVRWFRPLARLRLGKINHRTHRKVLVCDEAVGFTGGVGIADEWRGDARNEDEWRDTHFRIQGPAVDGLRAAFLDNWLETDLDLFDPQVDRFPPQPQPGSSTIQVVRGASEVGTSDICTLLRALIKTARIRIRIATAYFVPGDDIEDRLCEAARRGVVVEVLVPGPHADKRFVQLAGEGSYEQLLDAGVRVWSFQPSMLHAKVMTVDHVASVVGSANLNTRSVAHDEEIDLVVLDPNVTAVLDRHFEDDLTRSRELEPGRWSDRSMAQRAKELLIRPLKHFF